MAGGSHTATSALSTSATRTQETSPPSGSRSGGNLSLVTTELTPTGVLSIPSSEPSSSSSAEASPSLSAAKSQPSTSITIGSIVVSILAIILFLLILGYLVWRRRHLRKEESRLLHEAAYRPPEPLPPLSIPRFRVYSVRESAPPSVSTRWFPDSEQLSSQSQRLERSRIRSLHTSSRRSSSSFVGNYSNEKAGHADAIPCLEVQESSVNSAAD
jgi:hypothetical protein